MLLPFSPYGFNISVLLVSIMLASSGICLGAGYALGDRRLKELGRDELFQSLINGALVGGFIVLFAGGGVVDTFINSVVLSNGTSVSCSQFMQQNAAICFAYNYLVGPGQYYYLGAYHPSVLSSASLLIASLISLYAALGAFGTFISPVLAQIKSAVQILGSAAVSSTVQASVMAFAAVSALAILLPLGLVFRSFYATRRMGSFLIALTIGLYIVLPLSYLMNATIASYYGSAAGQAGFGALALNINSIRGSALSYAPSSNSTSLASSLASVIDGLSAQLAGLVSYLFDAVAYFIVYAFILPAFSLMLTAISVKELSAILGSDNFFGKFNLL